MRSHSRWVYGSSHGSSAIRPAGDSSAVMVVVPHYGCKLWIKGWKNYQQLYRNCNSSRQPLVGRTRRTNLFPATETVGVSPPKACTNPPPRAVVEQQHPLSAHSRSV